MTTYETIFITPPNLTEDEERAAVDVLAEIVSAGGGSMVTNDRMGRRRLAYPIRKFEDGVYTRFLYDSESDVPKELERRIRLSDKVLRSLTVALERDWAVEAKEQAVRDAERRAEAEAEAVRLAAEEVAKAAEEAEKAAEEAAKAAEEAAAAPEPTETRDAESTEDAETAAPAPATAEAAPGAAEVESTETEKEPERKAGTGDE